MSKFSEGLKSAAGVVADVGSLISPIGGIASAVKGVGNLLGIGGKSDEELMREQAKLQYEYQTKLNEQQQEYARENAETEYNRQRELTSDQFSLEKQGKRAAGMSVAFGEGSSSVGAATVPSIASPYAGSAGLAAPNIATDRQYKQMESAIGLGSMLSNVQKQSAEIKGIELDNNLKLGSLKSNLSILRSKADSAEAKASIDKIQAKIDSLYAVENASYDNIMKEVASSFAKEQATADLQYTIQSIENLKMQYKKGSQEYNNLVTAGEFAKEQLRQLIVQGAYQPQMLDLALRKGNAEVGNIDMDTRLKSAKIDTEASQQTVNYANARVLNSNANVLSATEEERKSIIQSSCFRALMDNVPTSLAEKVKHAVATSNYRSLTSSEQKQVIDAINFLLEKEYDNKANESTLYNISVFRSLLGAFGDVGDLATTAKTLTQ